MTRAGHIAVAAVACVACVAWAACGGNADHAPPTPRGPAASLEAPRASPDDAIVATVDGHPVWASCVTDQLQRGGSTSFASVRWRTPSQAREGALHDCVDVELLARAAERRGLAIDPDVTLATRAALVNRLVEVAFEDRVRTVADLPTEQVDAAFAKNGYRMHRPEVRASAYARINVAAKAPPGGPEDTAAHALADKIAAAVAPETGLFAIDLHDIANRVAAGTGLTVESTDVAFSTPSQLVEPYANALYAIPAIGRTSPAFRTKWGWDVVLWTDVLPPLETSRDDLLAQMFPELRRAYFAQWVLDVTHALGIHPALEPANIALLDQLPVTVSEGLP